MSQTFKGGVHPDYRKAPEIPVTVITPPAQVVIPMAQHIGAPCQPLVKKGDYVTMGQKIGENPAPVSAPVHASVSGKVVAVEPRPHPLGDTILSIVIENDYQDTPCTDLAPLTEEQLKDPETILERIREAGVVGMGGAMFPTAFKIRGGIGKVDKLIINGAECEPYLNGDHLTMLNFPEQLLKGIELVRIASGVEKAYYGIEVNKQDAIDLLNSLHPENYGIEIVPEAVKYPQGGEKMQVKAVTGREVKPGGLPSGVGANVVSTRTCYAIYQACYEGKPVVERIVTVSGSALGHTCNALTRFGTPFGDPAEDRSGRPDDGHLRHELCRSHHQGHLGRSLLHRGGGSPRGRSHLHPLRQVHRGLPHEPGAGLHVHVLQQGRLRQHGEIPYQRLLRVRQLRLQLPRPHAFDPRL